MSQCPSLDTLDRGGPAVARHLAACEVCQSIVELMQISGAGGAVSALPDDACAKTEILIAACAHSQLSDDDGAFLRAHLGVCAACRETALEPPTATVTGPATVEPRHYVMGAEIGRGGMGRVLSARDLRIGRAVAVKEILATHPDARARFEREARITARLQHPGIVSVYEVGQWPDGRPFYAMPILSGRTLREALAEASSLGDRLRLLPSLIAATDAIAYAHSRRIIHRDLTPSNILLGSFGETVVIDWGIAKELDASPGDDLPVGNDRRIQAAGGLTVAGSVIGTPAYIAPEQATGRAVDERSDIYSLGAMLSHLLAGRPPYQGDAPTVILEKLAIATDPLPMTAPQAPRDLLSVARRATQPQPGLRYATAAAFAEDLRRFRNGERVSAHVYTTGQLATRWLSRHVAVVLAAAAAFALVAATAIIGGGRLARSQRGLTSALSEAQVNLAESLLQQGKVLALAGQWHWARKRYWEASDAFARQPNVPRPFAITLGLLETYHEAPPPLMTMAAPEGQAPIDDLAATPDGQLALVVQDGQVVVWETATGRKLRSFAPEGALAGDPVAVDKSRAAQGTLPFASVGEPVTPVAREGNVLSVVLSSDGKTAVTGGQDGAVRSWDVATGRPRRLLPGHDEFVRSLALSADGRHVLAGGGNPHVSYWNLATGQLVRALPTNQGMIDALALSPDGRLAAVCSFQSLQLWDLATGKKLRDSYQEIYHRCASLAFTGDSRQLLVGSRVGVLELREARSGTLVRRFEGHRAGIDSLVLSPDSRRALTASRDGELRLWDLAASGSLAAIAGPPGRHHVALTADARLALSGDADGQLRVHRLLPDWNAGVLVHHPRAVDEVALSQDGRLALASDITRNLVLVDVATGKPLQTISGGDVAALALAPDGSTGYWSDSRAVHVWDFAAAREVRSFPALGLGVPAFSADANQFITGLRPSENDALFGIGVFDVKTGKPRRQIVLKAPTAPFGTVMQVAVAATGRILAADGAGYLSTVNAQVDTLPRWQAPVTSNFTIDLSSDGNRAVSADATSVSIWHPPDGTRIATLFHPDAVRIVKFWPGRDLLLSAGATSLKVWDAAGKELHGFSLHDRPFASLALHPQMAIAATAGGIVSYDLGLPERMRAQESALTAARATLAHQPDAAEALATLGQWYLLRGEWAQAARLLTRAHEGGAAVPALSRARAHWQAGDTVAAAGAFAEALVAREAPEPYLRLCLAAVEAARLSSH